MKLKDALFILRLSRKARRLNCKLLEAGTTPQEVEEAIDTILAAAPFLEHALPEFETAVSKEVSDE